MADDTQPFDPSRYLTKIKGQDYLEVKWRIVWFRDRWPAGSITTEMISHVGNQAIFRAEVRKIDPDGAVHGSATGFGSEDINGFANYIEKAETKAIGRALGALGFGTQFSDEFGDENNLADTPVQRGNSRPPQQLHGQGQRQSQPQSAGGASEKQIKAIYGISKGLGWSKDDLLAWLNGPAPEDLTAADASAVIGELNAMKAGNQ